MCYYPVPERKQAGTQLLRMGYKRKKLIPTRSVNMSVHHGTSTVVTGLNVNPQGEKLPGTD